MSPPAYENNEPFDAIPLGNMDRDKPGFLRHGFRQSDPSDPTDRGIGFFKPRSSYKCLSLVLVGVVFALMATTIGLGVALGKMKAHPSPPGFPNFGPGINATDDPLTSFSAWNSSACTQPQGTCLALLDATQVDNCFELVWSVCHANYNATYLVPQRNDTMFMNNPQCSHLITQMYCQWESDLGDKTVCDPMKPFCGEEFPAGSGLIAGAAPTGPLPPGWSTVTFTETETIMSYSSGATTGVPIATTTVTGTMAAPPSDPTQATGPVPSPASGSIVSPSSLMQVTAPVPTPTSGSN